VPIKSSFASRLIYPDPLKATGIEFDLPASGLVTLVLFDQDGRAVGTLIDNQSLTAGKHIVDFVSHGFVQGVYFYRLTVDTGEEKLIDTKLVVVGG